MSFEFPGLLLGMLGGLIPIIIHLINRQRAKVRPFAAIDYLLLSDKRLARRLRIKQLLVLALRVLLLVAIPFALAKPYVEPEALAAPDPAAPGAIALVIDDSLSARATPDGWDETILQRSLAKARALIKAGGSRTSYAVLTGGKPARLLTQGLTYDRNEAERALNRVIARSVSGDLPVALREAERVLGQSDHPNRHVYVLGDQAQHAWRQVSEPWALARVPSVELVDVRDGKRVDNVAISSVTVEPAPDLGAGQVRVEVSVVNHGGAAQERDLEVDIGGQPQRARISVGVGATEKRTFAIPTWSGARAVRGFARITPDAIAADDTWYFSVDFGGTASALIINGAPASVPFKDELFFVRAALQGEQGGASRVRAVYTTGAEWAAQALQQVDVVVLANVGQLSGDQRVALHTFVEGGGGLLIAAGDRLTPESNASYGSLLPLPIRGVKQVARRDDPASALSALRLDTAELDHPALREFARVDEVSLFKARFYAYVLVDAARDGDAKVLASYSGGIPALVERSMGRGRILLLTSTLDRDWSDLAIKSSFLPLLQQLIRYLGGKMERDVGGALRVGEPTTVPVPEGEGPLTLERPDGSEVPMGEVRRDVEPLLEVTQTDVVGHYTLRRASNQATATVFAVNADRDESDLGLADLVAVRDVLKRPGAGTKLPEAVMTAAAEQVVPDENRTRVWPAVLFGLFLLLASETWLVIKG